MLTFEEPPDPQSNKKLHTDDCIHVSIPPSTELATPKVAFPGTAPTLNKEHSVVIVKDADIKPKMDAEEENTSNKIADEHVEIVQQPSAQVQASDTNETKNKKKPEKTDMQKKEIHDDIFNISVFFFFGNVIKKKKKIQLQILNDRKLYSGTSERNVIGQSVHERGTDDRILWEFDNI
ncbi:hypothetical protein RFI_09427 [Reticulomyxa filosa]|uniref:Uncharacterized protein n=1 Tax=Reticulomyxa filosa TaxID=46433 RepID=X6NPS4_RETFI|nr:hypothetical protein RFI_09427 [Reticulomyxa filosa]|eukprot:ETO27709.1 hypothetical protein RFI_09427 [Reticulomyxa filosa]